MKGKAGKILASIALYAVGLAALAGVGYAAWRLSQRAAHQADATELQANWAAGPPVSVMLVGQSPAERTRILLGEARPWAATTLYAKVAGYLREIKVDRGDKVKAGELLAVLESPELDQQLLAADADAKNKKALAQRSRRLVAPGIVPEQDAEAAETNARVSAAQAQAAQVQRDYRMLRAPFDGEVTARYADPGALLQSATGSQTTALPIVRVAKVNRLRVTVFLDQFDAELVHVGDAVVVALPDQPLVKTTAKISRLAGELDAKTRTELCEIDVDNGDGRFPPGGYLRVTLQVQATPQPEIPAEALVVRHEKTFVAVVRPDNHVEMRPVVVLDQDGKRVQLLSGVQPGERVVVGLGDSADDGQKVQPVLLPQPATPGAKGKP